MKPWHVIVENLLAHWGEIETRGDAQLTVKITFPERHLMMVITRESLQNITNIVNAVVIKIDCQYV